MSGPTKAELQQELGIAKEALKEAVAARRQVWDDFDTEAYAIHQCVSALNHLTVTEFRGGSREKVPEGPSIRRVLDHLEARYGVAREPERRPCDLPHLEDATDEQLIARLRGWFVP